MQFIKQLKNYCFLRVYSFLTGLVLCLSILFSIMGTVGGILFQAIASTTIVFGTILEILHILIIINLTDKNDDIGWILHRFAYVTLLVVINSFLMVASGTFLSSFSFSGSDLMIIPVIGYVVQATFGVCLSAITYHFLQIDKVWRGRQ